MAVGRHPEIRTFFCRRYLAPTGWPPEACGLTVPTGVSPPLRTHALEHVRPRHSAAHGRLGELRGSKSAAFDLIEHAWRNRPASAFLGMLDVPRTRSSRDALLPRTFSACQIRFNGCFVSCAPPAGRHSAASIPRGPNALGRNSSIDSDAKGSPHV